MRGPLGGHGVTRYVVAVISTDEDTWERASDAEKEATYARDQEFVAALAARGHRIVGGAELAHSRETRIVRAVGGDTTVTEGPYAESTEQVGGFYLVECDDRDDLLRAATILARDGEPVEVRPCTE